MDEMLNMVWRMLITRNKLDPSEINEAISGTACTASNGGFRLDYSLVCWEFFSGSLLCVLLYEQLLE